MLFKNWYYLSNNMTAPERALEPHIAALGERYRSQWLFMLGGGRSCISDFVLLDRKVVLEVDGSSHDAPKQIKKDLENTLALMQRGWQVVRVRNEDAEANPAGTVASALTVPRTDPECYQAALDSLLRNYPELAAGPAKRPKSSRPAAPKSAPAARKASGTRRTTGTS